VETQQVPVLGEEFTDRDIALLGGHRLGGRPTPRFRNARRGVSFAIRLGAAGRYRCIYFFRVCISIPAWRGGTALRGPRFRPRFATRCSSPLARLLGTFDGHQSLPTLHRFADVKP